MKKLTANDLKVIEINENVYQIEAGKRAIVIRAKSPSEALKLACRYLGINCSKNALHLSN
ncbi:hypothetical protein LNAT_P0300 [Lebetimonas natsushimae]|uniref:Uncharacterized protein n=1 Tax=Lebetimonas natsushimae TaxID=1936991 RepID=A0A292YCB4_9BACT|nr:hypothetical protein [Lebetimonas natsushimae]GAX87005.1 hypothetical protein LNAT_P0300 [Lebetimonas natsushimae]